MSQSGRRRVRFLLMCFAFIIAAALVSNALDYYFWLSRGTTFGCVFSITVIIIVVAGLVAAGRGRLRREPMAPTDSELSLHARLGEGDLYDVGHGSGDVGDSNGGSH